MKTENLKVTLGYILICLLWGSTWLAIRIGLDSLTPIFAAGLRFSVASVFIYLIMKLNRIKLQTDSISVKLYIILGFFSFVIPFALVYWAEQFIASGLTSVIFSVMPFFVILFAALAIKQEIISPGQIIGVVLGFLGITAIFSENLQMNFQQDFWGMSAILLSSIMQAATAVMIKKHGQHLHPLSMNFIPLVIGGVVMVTIGLIFEDGSKLIFDSKAIFSVIYLAFFGTVVAFSTYYWLMKRISVIILSLSSFITPIIAILLGWLLLSEKLSSNALLGSGLVLVGILFANFGGLKSYLNLRKILK